MADKRILLPDAFGLSLSQAEVDFVIPDLANDIPVCIDPFLLYKSPDETLRGLHGRLLGIFERGFALHDAGDRAGLDGLINFPEVNAIGFGYTAAGTGGSGLGWHLNQLLADLLESSDEVRARGLRHIEELQLLSVGVGPDRISDIAANILKVPLIEYTQQQAELWRIPMTKDVPVSHFFDEEDLVWRDGYFDLPLNPVTKQALLLVPRRIVRLLPWINYADFYGNEAQLLLPPKPKLPRYPGMAAEKRLEVAKAELVTKVRGNTHILDQYVARKERERAGAVPVLADPPDPEVLRATGEQLLVRLAAVPTGAVASVDYQRVVYEILNFLFEPELTDGKFEVATYLGTERRDLLYWNDAEASFWNYVRTTYNSPLVMFECKNVAALEIDHVNQTAAYLGARLGMLGFIATRSAPSDAVVRKLFSVYHDSPAVPRKVILVLSDEALSEMVTARIDGASPARVVQHLYRTFRSKVQ